MFNINVNTGEVYQSSITTKQKKVGKKTITDIHHEKTSLGNIYMRQNKESFMSKLGDVCTQP
jgi:hypothetical protein